MNRERIGGWLRVRLEHDCHGGHDPHLDSVGVVSAWLAVAAWMAMMALDLNLRLQLGEGFSASYWFNWLVTEGLLAVFAALASGILALQLFRAGRSRVIAIGVLIVAAVTVAGSLLTVTSGGLLPPAIGPLLGVPLGVLLVRTPRATHEQENPAPRHQGLSV